MQVPFDINNIVALFFIQKSKTWEKVNVAVAVILIRTAIKQVDDTLLLGEMTHHLDCQGKDKTIIAERVASLLL